MRSGLLWRLLSPHYVKPAVKKHSWFPPAACCSLLGEHPAPSTAVPGAGNPLPTPSTLTPAFTSCLHSSCTPLPTPLPLASAPTLPTPLLLRVTLQSLLCPREGLFLPSSWPLSSLPGIWSSQSRYQKSPTCNLGLSACQEPYPPADTCLTQKCSLIWILRWTSRFFWELGL